jgi:Secretion system C-terminal sorting domain
MSTHFKNVKTQILLATAFICALSMQSQNIVWEKTFGGSDNDDGYGVDVTSDGGLILIGTTKSNDGDITGNHGSDDIWVAKLTAAGDMEWQKCFGGEYSDTGASILETNDGGYFFCGITFSENTGDISGYHAGGDVWVVKISSTGTLEWQKCLGGSSSDFGMEVSENAEGEFFVAGVTQSSDGDVTGYEGLNGDGWVVKLSSTGEIIWEKTIGGSDGDNMQCVKATSDGGCITAGASLSIDGDVTTHFEIDDCWIVKLSNTGAIEWQKTLGGTLQDEVYGVTITPDGGYVFASSSGSTDIPNTPLQGAIDFYISKLSSTGDILWQNCLGSTGSENPKSIQNTSDGALIVSGRRLANPADGDVSEVIGGFADVWIIKISANGDLIWERTYGGTGDAYESAESITVVPGGYVFVGRTNSNDVDIQSGNNGMQDLWTVKIDDLSIDISDVEFEATPIKTFPVPAENLVNLSLSLPEPSIITYTICDLRGQSLIAPKSLNSNSGNVNLSLDISSLASGVYLLKTTINEKQLTSKIIVR